MSQNKVETYKTWEFVDEKSTVFNDNFEYAFRVFGYPSTVTSWVSVVFQNETDLFGVTHAADHQLHVSATNTKIANISPPGNIPFVIHLYRRPR